ncbi:hypothetical protein GQR58_006662 [Nymphon striatum]|nr:hypothetical protein GQR58_006662 [Nymphon striatum]
MKVAVKRELWLISLLSLFVIVASGSPVAAEESDTRAHILQAADASKSGEYVRRRFFDQLKKPFDPTDKRKKMLVIGDSHAQDFYNALVENNLKQRYQISTRRVPAICGLLSRTRRYQLSKLMWSFLLQTGNSGRHNVCRRRLRILQIKAPHKLFVIGRKSFGKLKLRNYLRLPDNELRQLRNPVYSVQREINQTMKQSLPKNVFVNTQALICKNENDCPAIYPTNKVDQL